MIRKTVLVGAAMLAVPATAQDELPNFEFRDAVAGATHEPRDFGVCLKSKKTPGEKTCLTIDWRDEVAGQRMEMLGVRLYANRLSAVIGTFRDSSVVPLMEAFTAKYGQPCETREEPWQSRMGVKTTNVITVWCFKTGKLELESVGGKLGEGRFTYVDDWQVPDTPPKVDF